jgi:uncharacterized protein YyaL (SSP411 family)
MTLSKSLLFISIVLNIGSCAQSTDEMHKHTNDLINETSPYLLQHAHNPVNWHAWSVKSLEEAKELNKPILISIGYSSCHWCHVMEHESFEDETVAAYMNENFYCIKVDREERPDVDQIYMTAANIITGRGGWPLNCFAMPDSRPFHAGTYYPKNEWIKLLQTVNLQYTRNKPKLEEYASKLTQGIRLQETAISDNTSQSLVYDEIVKSVKAWKSEWDMTEGGMNRAPKFPMPSNYNFLMNFNVGSADIDIDQFVNLTLTKMAYGGIFDQVGGGFARYSTDKLWKAPHFEKMLYDNAQLLTVYSKAYRQYEDELYLNVMNKTVDWLEAEMLDKSKLFYSALDADSEGEEGKFYVWTEDQLRTILKSDFDLIKSYYEVGKKGLWEHGNNILLRKKNNSEICKEFNLTETQLKTKIEEVNGLLYKERGKRIKPGLDDKCLTSWNGLIVTGLCEAYKATNNEEHKELALECIDALLAHQVQNGKLWHSYKGGKSTIDGMLEDYCFTALACLSVFEVTGEEKYAASALEITKQAIEHFYDTEKEIFYFNLENELIIRTSEVYDNVIPSSNSAMAHVLNSLGLLYANPRYLEMSETLIGKVQQNINQYIGGHSNWSDAHIKHSKSYYEIVVVGKEAEGISKQLNAMPLFNSWVTFSTKKSSIPLFEGRYSKGSTLIYVCEKGACKLPVNTINEALELIK